MRKRSCMTGRAIHARCSTRLGSHEQAQSFLRPVVCTEAFYPTAAASWHGPSMESHAKLRALDTFAPDTHHIPKCDGSLGGNPKRRATFSTSFTSYFDRGGAEVTAPRTRSPGPG